MSWFSNLAETYNRLSEIVGNPDGNGNILLPSGHMAANTDVCVVIDGDGNFRRVEESKKNIVIPCTEDSASRAGKVEYPHPLHEQVGYLASDLKKRESYLSLISEWSGSSGKVEAVHKYIAGGTLLSDLQKSGVKTDDAKTFVRFSVEITDDLTPHLWEDESVATAWQEYCRKQEAEVTLCYVTGEYGQIRRKHPKGVNAVVNSAKLISSNDDTNYTFRGRFKQPNEANAISDIVSQRAHAMLRYLIASQGYRCDSQAIVAWAIDDGSPAPSLFSDSLGLCTADPQSELEKVIQAQGEVIGIDYAKKLRSALAGRRNAAELRESVRKIAVIAVDAATTGRMAVTFYKDLTENEYIDRVVKWHETCCWWFRGRGIDYISAPSADRIIAAVFGEPKGEGYDRLKKQGRERLLHSILNGERVNRNWLHSAVQRVSNPFSYNKQDGGWDKYKWENVISVTCAIARKHYTDNKEEISLDLDKAYSNRCYLYGRLLAIADKIESHARFMQMKSNDTDKRPTNAVRYLTAFAAKPFRTWMLIYHQLSPYLIRLDGGGGYQKQIDEIMSLFKDGEYESDRPLDGKYLMGYSLQRRALNTKNNREDDEYAEQEN